MLMLSSPGGVEGAERKRPVWSWGGGGGHGRNDFFAKTDRVNLGKVGKGVLGKRGHKTGLRNTKKIMPRDGERARAGEGVLGSRGVNSRAGALTSAAIL